MGNRRLVRGACVVVALVIALFAVGPEGSRAATVIEIGRTGHAIVRNDPALPPDLLAPPPRAPGSEKRATAATGPTVRATLAALARAHRITSGDYVTYRNDFNSALAEVRRLSGTRAAELEAVIGILHAMAVDGTLTASRLPVLFLTLERNARYWMSGPLLSYGNRVEFAGSGVVWEYYPGQGIQLQVLGSFGKAAWYCRRGRSNRNHCTRLLAELIPLAVRRAGGLVWEYYFNFDGGVPPWTSAMSQGTALEALAGAYRQLHDSSYLTVGHSALAVFSAPPPAGVGVGTPRGIRYVQYSFAPGADVEVINAFLQTLIGLDAYARATGDPVAKRLFAKGNAEAQAELPHFNTGAWSLYQPGQEDDLSYHQLVTGFVQRLCSMTKLKLYCSTAAQFSADLKTPPALQLLTTRTRRGRAADLYFRLSKISHVGIVVVHKGATVFLTSAQFPYGEHAFAVPALRAGTYTVRLAATDLAGNFGRISTTLTVTR